MRTLLYEIPKLLAEATERILHHGHPRIKEMHRQMMKGELEVPEGFNVYEH